MLQLYCFHNVQLYFQEKYYSTWINTIKKATIKLLTSKKSGFKVVPDVSGLNFQNEFDHSGLFKKLGTVMVNIMTLVCFKLSSDTFKNHFKNLSQTLYHYANGTEVINISLDKFELCKLSQIDDCMWINWFFPVAIQSSVFSPLPDLKSNSESWEWWHPCFQRTEG